MMIHATGLIPHESEQSPREVHDIIRTPSIPS